MRVLILCTGNSARSQMAEGLLRHLGGGRVEAFSAGTDPKGMNPFAVRAMQEVGLDITGQRSKHLNEYLDQSFDYVITVCDSANDTCPVFPGAAQRLHWSYPDPAAVLGDDAKLAAFRHVRDGLQERFRGWLAQL